MEIRIDPHTLARARERGTTAIREVIRTGADYPGKRGRIIKAKTFHFDSHWRGVYYPQKRVEVVFVPERDVVTTVTVHVFYGRWER